MDDTGKHTDRAAVVALAIVALLIHDRSPTMAGSTLLVAAVIFSSIVVRPIRGFADEYQRTFFGVLVAILLVGVATTLLT